MKRLAARLLLDLGGVEKRGDDRRGADADRDPGLDELLPALLAGVVLVVVVGHVTPLEQSVRAHIYERGRDFGSAALMARKFKPLPVLEGAQAAAVDPNVHASVSASAGSGKTQVLTGRVLSLLLNGADPEAILCLTFTKAGAAEMANRIGARLAAWVRMKDHGARQRICMALRADPGPASRERARRLFAKVLEAPGGLRIQTIHSFAQALLASFPAEAGITPGFTPIEGRAEQELARTTLANLLGRSRGAG